MAGSKPEEEHRDAPPADAILAARTLGVYDRQARRFDAERPRLLHEKGWLDRFLDLIEPGGRVLDLGCGGGEPIAAYLMNRGYEVVGVDASEAMLAIARTRFPEEDWRWADMRRLDLGEVFDGVISWDSFFHLMPDEQRNVLSLLAGHMNDGAALMLTVGPEAGEVTGWVGGEPVYHASLAPLEYKTLLHQLGIVVLEFVPEDTLCDGHTILLAQKSGM